VWPDSKPESLVRQALKDRVFSALPPYGYYRWDLSALLIFPFTLAVLWPWAAETIPAAERAFWKAIVLAFACWRAASLSRLALPQTVGEFQFEVVRDFLNLGYYFLWFSALAAAMHFQDGLQARLADRRLLVSAAALIACLFAYFKLIPARLAPAASARSAPSWSLPSSCP
jgi:hypothetical protein